jgi:dCTP deaminase
MSGEVVDPKNFNSNLLIEKRAPYIDIPPNSYCLTRTVEYFRIPRNVMTICVGKSTYARCCLIVNVTPFEPEWCGFATMEISNSTTSPVRVYANEGIAQVIFFESDEMCSVSYKDKKGRYDKQMKLTLPFVEK